MKANQLKVGAILSYISMGIGYLISIAYTPIMLRLLGQSEYGLYNLVSSVVSYLGVLNFGFGSAYIRYYSKYKSNNDDKNISKLNGMFLIIFTFLGIVAVLVGSVLVSHSNNIFGSKLTLKELSIAKNLMKILVINLALSFPSIVFSSYITVNENFVFQKVLTLIRIIINPFAVIPILLMGYGSVGMVIITTFLNLLIIIINIVFCIKKNRMEFSFKDFDFKLMKEMTVFSSFIFINLLIDQINWNVDKFILGRYKGTISVAIYGLASQLNMYYISISTAISSVFVPRIHKIVSTTNDNKVLTELFTRIGRIQFLILSLIATGFIFFGRPFVYLWAGNNYIDSYLIALILILPVTLPLIQNIGIEIQRAKNMHKFRSIVYFFIAIINISITIPLSKLYGGIGAAIGTGLSLIIGNGFIMNWYYDKRVGLDIKYFLKQIFSFFPSFIIPVITGLLIRNYVNLYSIGNLLLFILIYTIVYCISIVFLGMNEYEKKLFVQPLIKFYVKIKNRFRDV
jgi:O-antigen/teichoic acid export membrane protein